MNQLINETAPVVIDLDEDGESWIVTGVPAERPDDAVEAVRRHLDECGVLDDYNLSSADFEPEFGEDWYWEPVDVARPEEDAFFRSVQAHGDRGYPRFAGFLVRA